MTTIIDQMNKFFKNCFVFEFDLKNPGRTRTRMAIKKKAGTSSSNSIYYFFQKLFAF